MLTGVVIASNEEKNLPLCLPLLQFCTEVLVVDNNSSDKGAKIARELGAKVIPYSSTGDYSAIRNFALKNVTTKWVLFVDADEIVTPELSAEIMAVISHPEYVGYFIPRLDYLWGKQLRFGDTGKIKLLRLGRKDAGLWQGRVHETWKIENRVGTLHYSLLHYPHPSLSEFLISINHYSNLRAGELHAQGIQAHFSEIVFYPVFKFFHLWLIKLGFLDGTPGFIHAMIMSFYSFLVRGKLYLLAKNISDSSTPE